jgi:hypothetical protein
MRRHKDETWSTAYRVTRIQRSEGPVSYKNGLRRGRRNN